MVMAPQNVPTPAAFSDLLRVHDLSYLRHLEAKCNAAASASGNSKNSNSSSNSSNSSSAQEPDFYSPPGMLDSDTPLKPQSLAASRDFCGAAILAIDAVMVGWTGESASSSSSSSSSSSRSSKSSKSSIMKRAFVVGRPPGHHAGPRGCVPSRWFWKQPDMTSSGFCLLNTVAVAAAYARQKYGQLGVHGKRLAALQVRRASAFYSSSEMRPPSIWLAAYLSHIYIYIYIYTYTYK